jgi:putative SOS response-associated peptidase YedK
MAEIHYRMSLILGPSDYARWLSDEPDPRDLMRPFAAEPMWISTLCANGSPVV